LIFKLLELITHKKCLYKIKIGLKDLEIFQQLDKGNYILLDGILEKFIFKVLNFYHLNLTVNNYMLKHFFIINLMQSEVLIQNYLEFIMQEMALKSIYFRNKKPGLQ